MSKQRAFALASVLLFALVAPTAVHAQGWVSDDWQYRMSATAVEQKISGTETFADFPLHVSLDGPAFTDLFGKAKPDGSDLLITAGDGTTVLAREVVGFDPVTQLAEIWVRMPAFSRTDNRVYLYYGNPDTTLAAEPADAWSSDYRVVYHFDDDPGAGVLTDSSPQNADAVLVSTRNWTSSDVMQGPLHQAWNFNGTTHHISSRAISSADSNFVVSAWIQNIVPSVDFVLQCNPGFWKISSQINGGSNKPDFASSGWQVRWEPDPLPFDGAFHHFMWVFDAVNDTVVFHFDGEPMPIRSTYPANLSPIYKADVINPARNQPVGVLGPMYYNTQDLHTGGGDEYRIRTGTVSTDWVRTEYNNQSDALGFFVFGAEETNGPTAVGGTSASIFYAAQPNPFRATTEIRFGLARPGVVELAVYDVAGRRVTTLLDRELGAGMHRFTWDGRSADGGRVAAGLYFVRLVTPDFARSLKVSHVR